MSDIRFATCDRARALSFLEKHYPNRVVTDTEESASAVLDLVADDVFRIPDPDFHGGTVYPSKNWPEKEENQQAAIAVLQSFHDATVETQKGQSNGT